MLLSNHGQVQGLMMNSYKCDKCGQSIVKEWENEPNELAFFDKITGYQCYIKRRMNDSYIYLCGYVKIEENHPFHGLQYDNQLMISSRKMITIKNKTYFVDEYEDRDYETPSTLLDFYRGITYSDFDDGSFLPKGFWYGFTCSHSGDLYRLEDFGNKTLTYRNIEYVKNECLLLARKLKEMES